jgi:hypothetical protein
MNNLALFAGQKVPEHLRVDYPKFVDFLEAYYKFHEQYIYDFKKARDVDETSDYLLDFLKREFASRFPKAQVNERQLIKIVRQLYQKKGTVSAIEMLFKLFFNEVVTVSEPNRSILRASDGKWVQTSFIRVRPFYRSSQYSNDPNEIKSIKIVNDQGTFFIEVDRVEEPANKDLIFYYSSFKAVPFVDNQIIDYVSNDNLLLLRGNIVPQPSKVDIINPGKYWKVGQIVRIPGTFKDSVARVTSVDGGGRIKAIEVADYGYDHTTNQVTIVSPFPNKPEGSSFDLAANLVAYNPATGEYTYDYVLTLGDFADAFEEEVIGVSDIQDENSYFASDYVGRGYTGKTEFYKKTSAGQTSNIVLVDPGLTIEKWLESRATLVFTQSQEVKLRGYYLNEDGQLSSPGIRLQDNYYYQLFSYVIESQQNIEAYRGIINQVHPAGLKFFGQLAKTANFTIPQLQINRTISRNTVYLDDAVEISHNVPRKPFTKNYSDDTATGTDSIASVSVIRASVDSASGSDTQTLSVVKLLDTSQTSIDSIGDVAFTKGDISDTTSSTDSTTLSVSAVFGDAISAPTDSISSKNIAINKAHGVDAVETNTTPSLVFLTYTAPEEQYFANDYVSTDQILTVG